jgi:hypothetical protein
MVFMLSRDGFKGLWPLFCWAEGPPRNYSARLALIETSACDLWSITTIDRYKPPLDKTVVIKLDYLVDRGVPGLSSKNERSSNGDRSRRFRYQR